MVGFSVRLAPGVRVSATSRGVRTSLGPRVARVHVGAGRPAVSTGAGPFTVWTGVGASRSRPPTVAVSQIQGASKAEQAKELADAIDAICSLHRQRFAAATCPTAAPVVVPPPDRLRAELRAYAVRQVGLFKWAERSAAKAWADREADAEHQRRLAHAAAERERAQAELDALWARLISNEPDVVLTTLADAFADNDAPAAPVGVHGDDASIVVVVPGIDVVPERIPSMTDAGNVSLRKATKTQTAALYAMLVSGYVLATVNETLAVAPGLQSATVVVVRPSTAVGGRPAGPECILAARVGRSALKAAERESRDGWDVLLRAATQILVNLKGQARNMVPLDLAGEPEIVRVLAAVNLDDLARRPIAPAGAANPSR